MFATLNKVGSLESTGIRRLGNLEKDTQYGIVEAEKIPMQFGEKVHLEIPRASSVTRKV